jgi:hypothetical protein
MNNVVYTLIVVAGVLVVMFGLIMTITINKPNE